MNRRSRNEFGSTTGKGFKYNGSWKRKRSNINGKNGEKVVKPEDLSLLEKRFEEVRIRDEIDEKLGRMKYIEGPEKIGWLTNIQPTLVKSNDWPSGKAGVDLFFIEEDGQTFKTTVLYEPYFYIMCKKNTEFEVEEFLKRRYENLISKIERIEKDDLDMPNHLLGVTRTVVQLKFRNVKDLLTVRKYLLQVVTRNEKNMEITNAYSEIKIDDNDELNLNSKSTNDIVSNIIDIREYDVPYYIRVAIDNNFRVGCWYTVKAEFNQITITPNTDMVLPAEPVVLAFDIETTKSPLKFPDSSIDLVMMISYMIDGQGFLITNREIVSEDILDFEYTPKPEYEGPFIIFNEKDEAALLNRFFEHIIETKPSVFVTYNGDNFDWPFIEARAKHNGINMYKEIGFYKDETSSCYRSSYAVHMDCLCWVKRDSYLPVGSHGLKAVTTAKLGYNPMEIDPEDMTRFAIEQPQTLSQYSVSDAVATYYLYMKYVHPFIFSLCNIIPLCPDEVLRKGSGTLCESLLMVQAYLAKVIMPNKHIDPAIKMYEGHLLDTETYVGGHVEALEAGVFRSDLSYDFNLDVSVVDKLINDLDKALKFSIEVEGKQSMDDVLNLEEIREDIYNKLINLRQNPIRKEPPLIYHLDVGAMYPNIILTNRLQPDALVSEKDCASCDFNQNGSNCQRRMQWQWRGECYPGTRAEYNMIKSQLMTEKFPPKIKGGNLRDFSQLNATEQATLIHKRLGDYCQKVYKRKKETKVVERESIVCQREHPFYVNTVRNFRDRRYEYKGLLKRAKRELSSAMKSGINAEIEKAKKMVVLYDSLQLAHKCILNSFYGYVMRKGSRWYSMEMAGVVCFTGSNIIQMARQLVERIGRPLELDTDGIWCILPKSFPENYIFKFKNDKVHYLSYPCVMLNHLVHDNYTNHQYQTLVNENTYEYQTKSENSIFFEVDGPYRAMILPSSTQEDKLLKKRYAVFNPNGSLAELKGFEVKRRGELKLIKIFQKSLFSNFLKGDTLEECYASVAKVADQWLDLLFSKGKDVGDEELFELISENRSMSKSLEEYGSQKSTSISTARRLAEFLGDQMVKDKGLACKFIISAKPAGYAVSERAIPVAIFQAEPSVKKYFLKRWLKDSNLQDFDIRSILDWQYYLERFGSVIQKLITIPAAMQKVRNPVPRIHYPEWLFKRLVTRDDKLKQHHITDMFKVQPKENKKLLEENSNSPESINDQPKSQEELIGDMEDMVINENNNTQKPKFIPIVNKKQIVKKRKSNEENNDDSMAVDDIYDDKMEDLGEMPDMDTDYPAWLEYMKKKWKRQRINRMKRRKLQETNGSSFKSSLNSGALSSLFQKQNYAVMSNCWEILSVTESEKPGEFRLWVLVDGRIQMIKLLVPRIFYVNSKTPYTGNEISSGGFEIDENGNSIENLYSVKKVNKILPRSHKNLYLYEFKMPENVYKENMKVISSFISHPSIEGVYETQIPLLYRVLIDIGCITRVNREVVRNIDKGISMEYLQPEDVSKRPYLNDKEALEYIFLYHTYSDSRHIFCIYSTDSAKAYINIVDASQINQMPNMTKLYSEKRNAKIKSGEINDDNVFRYHEIVDWQSEIFGDKEKAFQNIQKILSKYHSERHKPTVLIIQSFLNQQQLGENIPSINDFPVVFISSYKRDNQFPALDWQRPICRRIMSHLFNVNGWLTERIALARYADIPFCNIENDYPIFLADIFFSRRLQREGMLLWYSPSSKPDLGSREDDENYNSIDEIENLEINVPGMYDQISMEIDLINLAVNTIQQANVINEIEGGGTIGFESSMAQHTLNDHIAMISNNNNNNNNNTEMNVDENKKDLIQTSMIQVMDENAISAQTFKLFRTLIISWNNEVRDKKNRFADMMIEHFYRWITSPSSKLYDPALFNLIHGIMKKVFMQLLAEFRNLGLKVIYANFRKIIIMSSKTSVANAINHMGYVIRTIISKQLFSGLELNPTQCWDTLIWMDYANFGGMTSLSPNATIDMVMNKQLRAQCIISQWNIKKYLPIAYQMLFDRYFSEYLFSVCMKKTKEKYNIEENDNILTDAENEKEGPKKNNSKEEIDFKRKLISSGLTRALLEEVSTIHEKYQTSHDTEEAILYEFPEPPGSYLKRNNATLEFVKYFCYVLSLDKTVEYSVRVLKRNLLELIHIREFSEEAQFKNPCTSFKLGQVICEYCNYCRDIDLCRENEDNESSKDYHSLIAKMKKQYNSRNNSNSDSDDISNDENENINGNVNIMNNQNQTKKKTNHSISNSTVTFWSCPGCKMEYDPRIIEDRLLEIIQTKAMAFQLQDLVCTKCRSLKGDNISSKCHCGGDYKLYIDYDEFMVQLTTFKHIAKYYNMKLLDEVISNILIINSH
ncbi:putative DNA polymerase epsilon catalytic subunit A [Piromyces finnis]|uniref:DNA polymerase epsilon catalytic subunit n=1 Tax=Piromyces finnis TaxID=1754191 RepID=A0A1Y1V230_9FUNG|nr:putative DNA polymerase epsilon catalytic subunit A [Piromyces finnis]|eukprot:ORX45441.1 putative DNA polymerase epsilon catalytic subunit A [Piromyces finnis]